MDQQQFTAIMPYISADLVDWIVKQRGISEQEAISTLYSSQLYALLETESSKVWHYSTPMLYHLLEQEEQTGSIVFPDV